MIDSDKLGSKIAGHSNYHGDDILCAIYCMAEGKEIDTIKPVIEAEPIKRGRWIACTKSCAPLTEFGRRQGEKWYGFKCSECYSIYKGNALTESPWCQKCGAKMDEV